MEKSIDNFLNGKGQLTSFPSKRKMKLKALVYLSLKFEKGKIYSEKDINEILTQWHTFDDYPTLRRELINYKFLGRDKMGKTYWLEEIQPNIEELEN